MVEAVMQTGTSSSNHIVKRDVAVAERNARGGDKESMIVERESAAPLEKLKRRSEVSLFYDPPYESELDDTMARHLVAYLVPAASLEYKAEVPAAHTTCRFDFLIDLGTRRIAIDYTDTPENLETALVEDNDALVLGADLVDIVLRVRRRDLEERLYDCLHLISKWEPNLFTPYGQRIFASQASDEARSVFPEPEAGIASIYYQAPREKWLSLVIDDSVGVEVLEWPDSDASDESIVMRKMSRDQPGYWIRQYERASLVYGRAPIRRTQRA